MTGIDGFVLMTEIGQRMINIIASQVPDITEPDMMDGYAWKRFASAARVWIDSQDRPDSRTFSTIDVFEVAASLLGAIEADSRDIQNFPEGDEEHHDGDAVGLALLLGQKFAIWRIMFDDGPGGGAEIDKKYREAARRLARSAASTRKSKAADVLARWGALALTMAKQYFEGDGKTNISEISRRIQDNWIGSPDALPLDGEIRTFLSAHYAEWCAQPRKPRPKRVGGKLA